jgi:hypothetical protein
MLKLSKPLCLVFILSILVAIDEMQYPTTSKELEISLSWEGNN